MIWISGLLVFHWLSWSVFNNEPCHKQLVHGGRNTAAITHVFFVFFCRFFSTEFSYFSQLFLNLFIFSGQYLLVTWLRGHWKGHAIFLLILVLFFEIIYYFLYRLLFVFIWIVWLKGQLKGHHHHFFVFFVNRLLGTPSVYQSTLELTPTSYKDHCKRLYYLVEKQRELCGLSQNVLAVILNFEILTNFPSSNSNQLAKLFRKSHYTNAHQVS